MVATIGAPGVAAPPDPGPLDGTPQLETLDRGVVAVATDEGVALSWRLLASEVTGAGEEGQIGPDFAVYRDGERVEVVSGTTSYLDVEGEAGSTYAVAPVVHGVELEPSDAVEVFGEGYHDLPLTKPADGITPAGESYTYSANDASVADVDGDGAYEVVVKWDPSNSKDVSQKGYTGEVYLDTYELDGTLLNRIELGVNIRAGAHYTQFMTYDFDGDGRAESISWASSRDGPSTPRSRRATGPPRWRRPWGSRWSTTTPWTARPRRSWSTTSSTSTRPAAAAATTSRPSRASSSPGRSTSPSSTARRAPSWRLCPYDPPRGDDGLLWGDYAMSRIEPGNRVDRFLAGVAYLDGEEPSAVFARGYYTRTTLAAYDWDGKHLKQTWFVDSGHAPMSNPFNDGPHGVDGTDPEFGTITTQGFHSLSAADVDGDGRQEIVYGAATIDDDGSLLYSSFDTLPEGSAAPGEYVRLGHGDAMHVADLDPDRAGMEIWTVHENGTYAPYGSVLRDAASGEVLFGAYSGRDTGRGMVGDVRDDVTGLEVWASMPGGTDASGLLSVQGDILSSATPGTNMSIRWAGDLTTQIVNGSGNSTPTVDDWADGTLVTAEGTRTNNGTKGTPSLVADVLGDWREELLVRTVDSDALRIYTTAAPTEHQLTTLMHDPQYRVEVARQNTTYNQPSYTSYYLASDMDFEDVPVLTTPQAPKEQKFLDRPGTANDEVLIRPDRNFVYAVDGKVVERGRVPVSGTVEVVAVPRPWVSLAEGAEGRWSHTFGD